MSSKPKAQKNRVTLDASVVADDGIFDCAQFEKYLHDRLKNEGRVGNLAGAITITRSESKIILESNKPFTKRYMKYMTKKYLQKQSIRNFVRVLMAGKEGYAIVYPKLSAAKEEL